VKVEIKVPSVGESISEAIVSRILKPNGSLVKEDEEIIELETDKVNQVLHAPQSGELQLSVALNQVVKIGEVIGHIETEGKGEVKTAKDPLPPEEKQAPASRAPSARKMAPEFMSELKEPAEKKPSPARPVRKEEGVTRKPMSRLRKVIAQRLVAVKNQTAMLTTFNEVDMKTIMEIRDKEKENFLKRYGVKLGFMSFFTKAVVAALKAFPEVNSMIEGDEIITHETYHIGIAVSTEKGLMVPVVKECDRLTFGGIEQAIELFGKKARSGSISIDDLQGGSFTITNGGVFGSLLSTPILNPPQSAILGMHKIIKRPVVVDDQIVIRPMMYLALSYDHRIIDGKEAVQFLVHLKESLEDPARLLLEL
jgi:2-oxoglutarate dehydrogenase E2 component (dihydrolipoamide succinyltransferase)